MGQLRRRGWLKAVGATAAAAGAGAIGIRRARAAWGEIHDPTVWPNGAPQCKVLEIFLYGGLSQWETFYHRPAMADPFAADVAALSWACDATAPAQSPLPFADDASNGAVHLGRMTEPLWAPHIVDRMRTIVLQHDLTPHEAAIPLALTGRRLGRPKLAGLGAAVQHFWSERAPRPAPYAYFCVPEDLRNLDNVAAATAVGLHPASARPLMLKFGASSQVLLDQLDRVRPPEADELLAAYRSQYRDRTRWQGVGPMTRSAGLRDYETSIDAVLDAPNLIGTLTSAVQPVIPTTTCPGGVNATNTTAATLRTAARLLTQHDAKYVGVVDNGHVPLGDTSGYDTHGPQHVVETATNLNNVLRELAGIIQDPNLPPDPTKIDLDDTLVFINTEFGRTPYVGEYEGRDHFPQGYVNVLIGGPIPGRKILGALHPTTTGGQAIYDQVYGPADVHAAVMLAASIDCMANENFAVSDLSEILRGAGEAPTRLNVRNVFFT